MFVISKCPRVPDFIQHSPGGEGGTQWGMQLPNHNKLVTLFGAMMISMNYINLPVVSCYVNFPQVDPLIDDVLIFQRCSSWNLRKGIRLKKKMVSIFKIYSLQKCKSYQSINLHLLWGKLDYYNVAHVLALCKSYWAAMNKIFIYACLCINKMTRAFVSDTLWHLGLIFSIFPSNLSFSSTVIG